jgi:hypothetical protein
MGTLNVSTSTPGVTVVTQKGPVRLSVDIGKKWLRVGTIHTGRHSP